MKTLLVAGLILFATTAHAFDTLSYVIGLQQAEEAQRNQEANELQARTDSFTDLQNRIDSLTAINSKLQERIKTYKRINPSVGQ